MVDVAQEVETRFSVQDKATGSLNKMGAAAGRMGSMFDKASGIVGKLGGILGAALGALSIGAIVKDTTEFLGQVKKVQDYTGMTVEKAGGLLDVFAAAGIEGNEATRIFMRLSKASAKMDMAMANTEGKVSGMGKMYQRLGINVSKGPEAALLRMAELAKQGKTDSSDLMLMFGLQGEAARKLNNALKKGPEFVQETMHEFQKLGIATQENVDLHERMVHAERTIKETWHHITMTIGVKLLPVMADFMEMVAKGMDGWTDKAAQFGEVLGKFLKEHGKTILTIGKILLANFAVMKLTGTGLGGMAAKALMGKAVGGVASGGLLTGGAGAMAAAWGPALAAVAIVVAGFIAIKDNVDGIQDKLMATWDSIVAATGVVQSQLEGVFGPINLAFSEDSPIARFFMLLFPRALAFGLQYVEQMILGAAVLIDVSTELYKQAQYLFDVISEMATDVGAVISSVWEAIKEHFMITMVYPLKDAWNLIAEHFMITVANPIVAAWKLIRKGLVYVFDPWLTGLSALYDLVKPLLEIVGKAVVDAPKIPTLAELFSGPLDFLDESYNRIMAQAKARAEFLQKEHKAAEQAAKAKKPPAEREGPPINDFRGSVFNIKQAFAEGFDPDRIAVAFTNDLAALGDMRRMSGYGVGSPHAAG